MFEVKVNTTKNRMFITVTDTIQASEIDAYRSALKKNVPLLKTGFTTLIDLRKASVFDQETMQQLQGTKEIAVAAGLTKSAMIVESPTLKMQMNRNFKDVGPQDKAFNDISEAEKFLDEK